MKWMTVPALLIAGFLIGGCQQTPPEPQVGSSAPPDFEQPAAEETSPSQPSDGTTTSPETTDTDVPETPDEVARMSLDEFIRLKEAGEIFIVDVRSPQYYVQEHIPGAVNIPGMQLDSLMGMIPRNKQVVTYCT